MWALDTLPENVFHTACTSIWSKFTKIPRLKIASNKTSEAQLFYLDTLAFQNFKCDNWLMPITTNLHRWPSSFCYCKKVL